MFSRAQDRLPFFSRASHRLHVLPQRDRQTHFPALSTSCKFFSRCTLIASFCLLDCFKWLDRCRRDFFFGFRFKTSIKKIAPIVYLPLIFLSRSTMRKKCGRSSGSSFQQSTIKSTNSGFASTHVRSGRNGGSSWATTRWMISETH